MVVLLYREVKVFNKVSIISSSFCPLLTIAFVRSSVEAKDMLRGICRRKSRAICREIVTFGNEKSSAYGLLGFRESGKLSQHRREPERELELDVLLEVRAEVAAVQPVGHLEAVAREYVDVLATGFVGDEDQQLLCVWNQ